MCLTYVFYVSKKFPTHIQHTDIHTYFRNSKLQNLYVMHSCSTVRKCIDLTLSLLKRLIDHCVVHIAMSQNHGQRINLQPDVHTCDLTLHLVIPSPKQGMSQNHNLLRRYFLDKSADNSNSLAPELSKRKCNPRLLSFQDRTDKRQLTLLFSPISYCDL